MKHAFIRLTAHGGIRFLATCGLVGLVALGGCTSRAIRPVPSKADEKPYEFESEGQVPPPAESAVRKEVDRVDVFEETPVSEGSVTVHDVEPVIEEPLVDEAVVDSMKTGPGFRVQVFASGSREAAESTRLAAQARLGTNAYVELVDGIYKVRVGDCRSRPQAEALRQRCQEAGYTDAWIVAASVRFKAVRP